MLSCFDVNHDIKIKCLPSILFWANHDMVPDLSYKHLLTTRYLPISSIRTILVGSINHVNCQLVTFLFQRHHTHLINFTGNYELYRIRETPGETNHQVSAIS